MKKILLAMCMVFAFGAEANQTDVTVENHVTVSYENDSPVSSYGFALDSCSVHFSPNGGTIAALMDYIGTAKQTIRLLAYNFTSSDIGNALIAAKKRGIDVQLVLDNSVQTEKNSQLSAMLSAGITTYIDHKHKIAHNKVILIDGEWIETGSFNYTDNAEKSNGENALICRGVEAYGLYRADWEKHKAHSVQAR